MAVVGLMGLPSCSGDDKQTTPVETQDDFIRAADMSFLPEVEENGNILYHNGQSEDGLTTLKNAGCNSIRLRLWKNPATSHSAMAEVKTMADRARALGMKIWLTVHYSDSWADPGQQTLPAEWNGFNMAQLKASVESYTAAILTELNPDIFQIGNETNDGFLWPMGRLSQHEAQYLELTAAAAAVIREQAPDTKIMLHFAGLSGADYYFAKMAGIDYDYIGLSYYPIWHGKNLTEVKNTLNELGAAYQKKVIIAETAYPFTLGWDDWTHNVVGSSDQIIPAFAATPQGQAGFLSAVRNVVSQSTWGAGFAYWGADYIAFNGQEATNGSNAENQALWDFDHKALPAIQAFKK